MSLDGSYADESRLFQSSDIFIIFLHKSLNTIVGAGVQLNKTISIKFILLGFPGLVTIAEHKTHFRKAQVKVISWQNPLTP